MRRLLLLLSIILTLPGIKVFAQPATISMPISIGRGNCGVSGGGDSVYFFNYVSPTMQRATYPISYKPRLKIGPSSTTNRFSLSSATISYNPSDQRLYYFLDINSGTGLKTHGWRWKADTTFASSGALIDTFIMVNTILGGVTFDNNNIGWMLEFPTIMTAKPLLRPINFNLSGPSALLPADTLQLIPGPGGIGDTLWNTGNGDITLLPNGQMYFNFDNKLYTPDYQSYNPSVRQLLKCTYIDTTRLPTGMSALVGLSYGDGDLIGAYSPSAAATYNSCGANYRRINPVTGDTSALNYNFNGVSSPSNGVRSVDMTQLSCGVGSAKKLVSIIPTGFPNQYDVQYDVFTKNFGSVPITNVVVKDSLGAVNGISNVSNVSLSFVGTPPPGVILNPAYNGTTNIDLLQVPVPVLKNFPVDSNNFTIRISARFNNIQSGVVYNNSVRTTAIGFNNTPLRDSSTNGTNPDLNQNDKPDDFGENQPTPFIILLAADSTPCNVLDTAFYRQDFGQGVGMFNNIPPSVSVPSASTQYIGVSTAPVLVQRFTVTDSAQRGDPLYWANLRDHTGNTNGRMMVINADAAASIVYRDTMPVACPGQQYTLSMWGMYIGNGFLQTLCDGLGGVRYPRFMVRVRDRVTGLVITQKVTGSLTTNTWTQVGIKWVMPPGFGQVILEVINNGAGGCGNDFAIDDIEFGLCSPIPTVSASVLSGCLGTSTTFRSNFLDAGVIPGAKDYQWQRAPSVTGPWANIIGANADTLLLSPVTASDTGRYYRLVVAAAGNIGTAACQYESPAIFLAGFTSSSAATSVSRNKNNICPGKVVQLSVVGGSLGVGAKWYWYTSSCGGALIDSGSSINVTPSVTTTYYVRAAGYCNITACVSVTVTINCDIDKDDDGIPDFVESNMPAAIANAYNTGYSGYVDNNNDYINDTWQADGDNDNDGIQNYLDTDFAGRVDVNADGKDDRFDFDLDGVPNFLDLDSDNDGIPDTVEAWGADNNGDGKIDNYTDTDNDGLSQNVDGNNTGANVSGIGLGNIDLDGDGNLNFTDLDSDNDGIPDIVEAGAPDINNDGRVDVFTDLNNDGITDAYLGVGAILITGSDTNSDGRADSYPNKNFESTITSVAINRPNAYDLDADGDGIVDVVEAGFTDANYDGRIDGAIGSNGWSTVISAMPGPLNIRNTDGDTNRDYLDIDSDNDGITDNIEGMTTIGYLLPGTADADGDGIITTYDNTVGYGGSGIIPFDFDGDGTPDYRDSDTDADGMIDRIEGNDFNFNRLTDDNVTLTGLDSDGDGLDNRFDSTNTLPKVTSYNMGNGGSTSGDAAPGTRSVVQQSYAWQTDRDWRYVGSVLPVQFVQLSAVPQPGTVLLNWTIIAAKDVSRFEIERSTDNSTFQKTGMVTDAVQLNVPQSFAFTDDISSINNTIIYYRIKVIGKAGEIKYTNVVIVRLTMAKTPVSIQPNPTKDYVQVRFFAEKDGDVQIRIIDKLGKTVLQQNTKAAKGNNTLMLNGLHKYASGMYSLQLLVNGSITSEKLIITN